MVSARIAQNKRRVASYIGAGIVPPQGGGVPANAILLRDNSPLTLRDNTPLLGRAA